MNKQDYKNELLQIISYEYEETFRKKVIKKFKSMKIVIPIMYTIYIYILH